MPLRKLSPTEPRPLVLIEKVWKDDRMVGLQDDLERMTLNSYEFPAGQSIYQDARGQKLGNAPGRTTVVYVGGSLLDESEADIRMVARVVTEPMRYMFAAPSQEANQYTEGRDDLTADELDVVVGYMCMHMREDLLNPTSPRIHTLLAFRHLFDNPPLSLFLLFHEEALPFPEMARAPGAPLAFFYPFPASFDIGNCWGAQGGGCTGR